MYQRPFWLPSLPQALQKSIDSLLLTVFPSRCGACDESLPYRAKHRLCGICYALLESNQGSRCPVCDLPTPTPTKCTRCKQQLPAFSLLRAPYLYSGPVKDLIIANKFAGREDLSHAMAHLILTDPQAQALLRQVTTLVPIPLGRYRQWQRGYNQSALLARALAHRHGLKVTYALQRQRETRPQSDLSLAERRNNVREAFKPIKTVSGVVLLIDDVITSGQTVHQAAKALYAAQASSVVVLAMARAIDHRVDPVAT